MAVGVVEGERLVVRVMVAVTEAVGLGEAEGGHNPTPAIGTAPGPYTAGTGCSAAGLPVMFPAAPSTAVIRS